MPRHAILSFALLFLSAGLASSAEHHVAVDGDDANDGSSSSPLRTISAAASIAQPGDIVTVHEGVYREWVNPPRGGTSEEERIVYQAAPGEKAVIKGSEVITGWRKVEDDVWKVILPNSLFGDYNPYDDVIGGEWCFTPRDGFNRHTGAVYLNGDWLDEAPSLDCLLDVSSGSTDQTLGGKTADYPGKAIAGTDDAPLYRSCRYDLKGYRLAVPNGRYRVTLKFCEPHFNAAGKRVFDVKLQGKAALEAFDIFAQAGRFAAHDEAFDNVEVTEGRLEIDIVNRVSMACISGIVVENDSYTKKINCGGPTWNGYRQDRVSKAKVTHGRPLWHAEVDGRNTTIWAQFEGVDPNEELVEINVRKAVFYPEKTGRNYITVRGFTMRHAATPWSGAMSEQIGLVGTHWSKGWVIEDNVISHSMNTGVTLGRYDLGRYGVEMPEATAPGFVESCELALEHGWSKDAIGSHVVRNNHISHCEKNGIHGSLGGIFSTIEGNTVRDIAVRGWIHGPDVAGLKLLASNDVLIRGNHFYRCGGTGGVWLDWMAQGTRMTGNLLHDNSNDLFMEVDHGPFLIDHNIFLSSNSLRDWSQGAAYVHNLFAGSISLRKETRETPYFQPHSMKNMKVSDIQHKDLRFYNNLFIGGTGLLPCDQVTENLQAAGNVYLAGAKPSAQERDAMVVADIDPGITLEEVQDGWRLETAVAPTWISAKQRPVVTTELLGTAEIPGSPFENPDGTPYRLDTDYLGRKRNATTLTPGPFELPGYDVMRIKVWPRDK